MSDITDILRACYPEAVLVARNCGFRSWMPYMPGDAAFACVPDACGALCCGDQDIEVGLSFQEIALIQKNSGYNATDFARADRIMKKSRDGRCIFLTKTRRCHIYQSRPDSCIIFPFRFGYFMRDNEGRLTSTSSLHQDPAKVKTDTLSFCAKSATVAIIPMLYYFTECPGFSGVPVSLDEYLRVMEELCEFTLCYDHNHLCRRHQWFNHLPENQIKGKVIVTDAKEKFCEALRLRKAGDRLFQEESYRLSADAYMNAIRLSEELPKGEFNRQGFRAGCYAGLSGALGKLGLHDEVLKVASAALAFFDKVGWLCPAERPNWLMVLVNKGSALACLGRPREALECLTRAKEMVADNEATIPGNRHWIQQLNQNIDSVRKIIEQEEAGKKWWHIFWR